MMGNTTGNDEPHFIYVDVPNMGNKLGQNTPSSISISGKKYSNIRVNIGQEPQNSARTVLGITNTPPYTKKGVKFQENKPLTYTIKTMCDFTKIKGVHKPVHTLPKIVVHDENGTPHEISTLGGLIIMKTRVLPTKINATRHWYMTPTACVIYPQKSMLTAPRIQEMNS